MATLTERLAQSSKHISSILKPEIAQQIDRQIESLRTDGSLYRALRAGAQAPAFSLSDQGGKTVSSAELLANGPLVVSFFRGTWCPFCVTELDALAQERERMLALGARLVAITPQSAANAATYYADRPIPFPILVDADGGVSEAYGLSFTFPKYLNEIYTQIFGLDLKAINETRAWRLPMPARYVIDTNGTIVDARVDPDYRVRPEPAETIAILERMRHAVSS